MKRIDEIAIVSAASKALDAVAGAVLEDFNGRLHSYPEDIIDRMGADYHALDAAAYRAQVERRKAARHA